MQEDNMSQLINTFKTILNNNNSTSNAEDCHVSSSATNTSANDDLSNSNEGNNNFNISPEMISNMANILKNSNSSNNTKFDNSSQNNGNNPSIDFETIMKVKSIMDTLNKKDDPRSNLLYSLKPYLRKTRQEKLDQYVNLLKITQVTDLFNLNKGDKK